MFRIRYEVKARWDGLVQGRALSHGPRLIAVRGLCSHCWFSCSATISPGRCTGVLLCATYGMTKYGKYLSTKFPLVAYKLTIKYIYITSVFDATMEGGGRGGYTYTKRRAAITAVNKTLPPLNAGVPSIHSTVTRHYRNTPRHRRMIYPLFVPHIHARREICYSQPWTQKVRATPP